MVCDHLLLRANTSGSIRISNHVDRGENWLTRNQLHLSKCLIFVLFFVSFVYFQCRFVTMRRRSSFSLCLFLLSHSFSLSPLSFFLSLLSHSFSLLSLCLVLLSHSFSLSFLIRSLSSLSVSLSLLSFSLSSLCLSLSSFIRSIFHSQSIALVPSPYSQLSFFSHSQSPCPPPPPPPPHTLSVPISISVHPCFFSCLPFFLIL